MWQAYSGKGTSLHRVSVDSDTSSQIMSKGKVIPGGGKFIIGQLHEGVDGEYPEGNIYQVKLERSTLLWQINHSL